MDVDMRFDDSAVELLSERGYDPIYGARPLRRVIQSAVEDLTAERMLDGTLKSGDRITVTVCDGEITLETAGEPARELQNV
jgi:ATPases with chaperone activity, ATP-binding subunit